MKRLSQEERLRILENQVMTAMSSVNSAECQLKWIIEEVRSLRHGKNK